MARQPVLACVVFLCESAAAGVAGWLIAAPSQSGEARGGDAVAIFITTVVVSAFAGFAITRTDLARRLMVANSAVVPLVGLIVFWARGADDAATWYGYLLVWSVMVAISITSSIAGYGLGRATHPPHRPTPA